MSRSPGEQYPYQRRPEPNLAEGQGRAEVRGSRRRRDRARCRERPQQDEQVARGEPALAAQLMARMSVLTIQLSPPIDVDPLGEMTGPFRTLPEMIWKCLREAAIQALTVALTSEHPIVRSLHNGDRIELDVEPPPL